jgi:hypothetical protein
MRNDESRQRGEMKKGMTFAVTALGWRWVSDPPSELQFRYDFVVMRLRVYVNTQK